MRFDVVVVGGGTAGCVLAARLSENADRRVCLIEAGPDYGPLADGRWPPEILDAKQMPWTHDWGRGGEDEDILGARIMGGCSAHNECVILQGSAADYDEWAGEWAYDRFAECLDRARATLRTAPRNTEVPGPFHDGVLAAAVAAGFSRIEDPNDLSTPVGIAPYPANIVADTRWNAAFAYLDPARGRANLSIVDQTLIDRVVFDGVRAAGVVSDDGRRFEAESVVLAAGAYFSPSILSRSGIGPRTVLSQHGITVLEDLPVGERLLDHCGTSVTWQPSAELERALASHEHDRTSYDCHLVLKAASTACDPRSWDLHVLPFVFTSEDPGRYELSVPFFHMKPLSTGRVRIRSTDPADLPIVERGFLSDERDLAPLLEALEIVRKLAAAEPLSALVAAELRPGAEDPERHVRETISGYYHPAGTCAIGEVVDTSCRVLGVERLRVVDASVMPTIPRANTNLTTAAIAERVAATLAG